LKPLVELKNVVRLYGSGSNQIQALRGLNMVANEGEFIAVMGPSGSGKSTLLNVIGGMDIPTAGTVTVDNVTINDMSESSLDDYRLNKIGFVFQSYNLIPSLTAIRNVELPLLAAGVRPRQAHERAVELFQVVGLENRMSHRPSDLSQGEQQRVAIATALANNPSLILADEPTGNLDSKTAESVVNYIQSIIREHKKTLILVTHDSSIARKADWIHIIRDGVIVSRIRPSDLDSAVSSYDEFLSVRIDQINDEIQLIDAKVKQGDIDGSQYMELRGVLVKTLEVLQSELAKRGHI